MREIYIYSICSVMGAYIHMYYKMQPLVSVMHIWNLKCLIFYLFIHGIMWILHLHGHFDEHFVYFATIKIFWQRITYIVIDICKFIMESLVIIIYNLIENKLKLNLLYKLFQTIKDFWFHDIALLKKKTTKTLVAVFDTNVFKNNFKPKPFYEQTNKNCDIRL